MKEMAGSRTHRMSALLASGLGLVLLVWGLALILTGHEVAQGYALLGVGAATFGSAGFTWRRRR